MKEGSNDDEEEEEEDTQGEGSKAASSDRDEEEDDDVGQAENIDHERENGENSVNNYCGSMNSFHLIPVPRFSTQIRNLILLFQLQYVITLRGAKRWRRGQVLMRRWVLIVDTPARKVRPY